MKLEDLKVAEPSRAVKTGERACIFAVSFLLGLRSQKVMLYNGQLDIIVANPLTEALLQTVDWRGLQAYKAAQRTVWKVNADDDEVAGYVRQVDNFYQVVVRDGGHILPHDQPARSFDMIQRFVENIPFSDLHQ